MAVSCEPADLASAAACFNSGYGPGLLRAIRILLFCKLLNGETVTCDIQTLADEANCFLAGLSEGQADAISTYLLCQVVNNGGGGGNVCVTCSQTVPVDPPDVGACDCSVVFGIGAIAGSVYVWDTTTSSWFPTISGP